MNRFLVGCGIVALIAVGVLATLITIFVVRAHDEEAEAQKATREAVLSFVTNWNEDELIKRADDNFKTAEMHAKLDKIFALCRRRLGTFKSLGKGTGTVNLNYFVEGKKNGYLANYTFPATFSSGPATIEIQSHKEPAGWKILYFNIKSEALMQ